MSNLILRLNKKANMDLKRMGVSLLASQVETYLPNLGILIMDSKDWFKKNHLFDTNDVLSAHEAGMFFLPQEVPAVMAKPKNEEFKDTDELTWGLQAINYENCYSRGNGAKVCVLDTGVDTKHPDLKHIVKAESMVKGVKVDDTCGHGTHCAGTIAGKAQPGKRKYGVAPECDLYVGKVFGDGANPGAYEEDILRGIEFGVENRCDVISMSLGSYRGEGSNPKSMYEQLAADLYYGGAIEEDPDYTCLLLAAAGNSSSRPGKVAPIGNPAACRGFHAIGALAEDLSVAYFSCGNTDGMSPLYASAPGVNVYSSWIGQGYKSISGTSMATPHAAGIAACYKSLLLEFGMPSTANDLRTWMEQISLPLGNIRDYGSGLLFNV